MAWSKKYCLRLTEISSFVCLVLSKDGGHRVSPRAQLLFLVLIKGMRRPSEFKIFLRDPRDGKIPLGSSADCKKSMCFESNEKSNL